MHDESSQLSALISDVYDAASDRTLWPAALQSISAFIPAAAVNLFSEDAVQKSARVFYSHGVKQTFLDSYFQKYIHINPTFPATLFFEVGRVIVETDIIPRAEMLATQFYKEWLRPQGLIEMMAAVLEKSATSVAAVAVGRSESEGLIDVPAVRRMNLIVPHVRRAITIGKLIDLHKVEAAALSDTLDGLATATFLVDAAGRLTHTNAAAQALLDQEVFVRESSGRLAVNGTEIDRSLHDLIAHVELQDAASQPEGTSVPFTARSGESYVAHVLALTSGVRRKTAVAYRSVAAIFVRQTKMDLPHPLEAIAATFKLTPAEMRVLMTVVQLGSAQEIATVLGISEATAKTHLRHIFDKTGVRRQVDLVKLVVGYMGPLG